MKYKSLNEVLIEWNKFSKEDSNNIFLKSKDIKGEIIYNPEWFIDKLIEYYNIIDNLLKSKKIENRDDYNFLLYLGVPIILEEKPWSGKKYSNDDVIGNDWLLENKDIFCDWARSKNGGALNLEGWENKPCFDFTLNLDYVGFDIYYKHYKKFEQYLVQNFKKKSLKISGGPGKIPPENQTWYFTISMKTKNPKGNKEIIAEWFKDTLQVCKLYIDFLNTI